MGQKGHVRGPCKGHCSVRFAMRASAIFSSWMPMISMAPTCTMMIFFLIPQDFVVTQSCLSTSMREHVIWHTCMPNNVLAHACRQTGLRHHKILWYKKENHHCACRGHANHRHSWTEYSWSPHCEPNRTMALAWSSYMPFLAHSWFRRSWIAATMHGYSVVVCIDLHGNIFPFFLFVHNRYLQSHFWWNQQHRNAIQYKTIQCNTIQYNTIQYNTTQHNTIQYNTIQDASHGDDWWNNTSALAI